VAQCCADISIFLLIFSFLAGLIVPLHALDRDALQKILKGVVAQEKYTYDTGDLPHPPGSGNALLEEINRFIENIWTRITAALGNATWLTMTLYIIMTALAIISIILLIRRLDLSRQEKRLNTRNGVTEEFNMDYQREIRTAKELVARGEKKHAISTALNALWLYLHHKGSINYMKSTTNREYVSLVEDTGAYPQVPKIVRDSETAVYAERSVSDERCNEILSTIITITAQ
jgi:hypothetical protein